MRKCRMDEKTLGAIAYEAWCYDTSPDDWQAVADAVIAAHEARRWREWETVPRDGTPFDAWHVGGAFARAHRICGCRINATGDTLDGYGDVRDDGFLSHWSPIPAPPQEVEHGE